MECDLSVGRIEVALFISLVCGHFVCVSRYLFSIIPCEGMDGGGVAPGSLDERHAELFKDTGGRHVRTAA